MPCCKHYAGSVHSKTYLGLNLRFIYIFEYAYFPSIWITQWVYMQLKYINLKCRPKYFLIAALLKLSESVNEGKSKENECLCVAQNCMNLLMRPQPASVPSVAGISYSCFWGVCVCVCVLCNWHLTDWLTDRDWDIWTDSQTDWHRAGKNEPW